MKEATITATFYYVAEYQLYWEGKSFFLNVKHSLYATQISRNVKKTASLLLLCKKQPFKSVFFFQLRLAGNRFIIKAICHRFECTWSFLWPGHFRVWNRQWKFLCFASPALGPHISLKTSLKDPPSSTRALDAEEMNLPGSSCILSENGGGRKTKNKT